MKILITGVAGFIGFHLAKRLLETGHDVAGIDNLNAYYDVKLKNDRLTLLEPYSGFRFRQIDLADDDSLEKLFAAEKFTHIVNLAAQAGVRYSLQKPQSYVRSNLVGFANLLECCRNHRPQHLVFASSSSIYGLNAAQPYSASVNADHPASLYAATKKSGELMAHAYSHLYSLPCTGLRFFTVYGPWGRPDMALYLFTDAILANRPIKIFNHGKLRRDFTYIDDITTGVESILFKPATPNPDFDAVAPDPASSSAPWRIYNIGNSQTVAINDFVSTLEKVLGKKAIREYVEMQAGDVQSTWADVSAFQRASGFRPDTPLEEGLKKYVAWHKEYYGGARN